MFTNIKRIFFDSGRVLIYPKSGDWMYPNAYKEYCKLANLPDKSPQLHNNFETAMVYLLQQKTIKTEDEEYEVFKKFYAVLFSRINGKDNEELIEITTKAKVHDYNKYLFFDDVRDSISRMKSNYFLGIITDAWPSVINVYKKANMLEYFDPFIVSSMFGTSKPEKELFAVALNMIKERPEECLFVDDSISNCKIAQEFKMNVVALKRNSNMKEEDGIKVVANLFDLENLLKQQDE